MTVDGKAQPTWGAAMRALLRSNEACFCSVFDDCWQTSYNSTHADKVDHCVPDESSFRE